MKDMVAILHGLALILYLLAASVLLRTLAGAHPRAPQRGPAVLGVAVLAHGAGLAAYAAEHGELPLVGLAPSLSVFALLIAAFLFVVAFFREARTLGLVLLPLVSLMRRRAGAGDPAVGRGAHVPRALAVPPRPPRLHRLRRAAVAFAAGLVYLLQFRELKGKRLGRVFASSSLDTLDVVGRRAGGGIPGADPGTRLGWHGRSRFRHSFAIGEPEVLWGS